MKAVGRQSGWESRSDVKVPAPADIAARLGIAEGDLCVRTVYEPRGATVEEASLLGIQNGAYVTHIRRTYYSDQGRPVETADIVVPVAHCEIVYGIPINRR